MGLREIARELNKKGVPTTGGGKWYAGTIKYILDTRKSSLWGDSSL